MTKKGLWWRVLLALVSAGALLQFSLGPASAQPQPNVPLAGNIAPAVAAGKLTPMGTADLSQQVTLVIGVKLPNPAGVQAAVAAVRSGRSAPLAPQQFVEQFAPTAADYQAVVSWLSGQGFNVQTSPNRLIVTATGSLGRAARVFGVTVNNYGLNGRKYYANATAPQIPANLASIIGSVAGLDSLPTFHTHSLPASPGGNAVAGQVYYDPTYGFTPLGIQTAYDVTPVLGTTTGQVYGTGQTVDIVIWNGLQQSDVDSFDSTYGLPAITVNQIAVGGPAPVPTDYSASGGSMEATLDVEMVHSLAPGAAIDVFEAPNNNFAPLEEAINEAVVQHNANVLSMSWGANEKEMFGRTYLPTMDAIFAQGAAEGMTLLAASGDSGKYQEYDNKGTPTWEQAVFYPASDPYVTGVGGTALAPTADGSYGGETAWNAMEGLGDGGYGATPPAFQGSGGGFSTAFREPAWQYSTVDKYTYTLNATPTQYNTNARGVPDLALNSGGGTSAYIDGGWWEMIGTSVACPSWAGLVALVDQKFANLLQPPLGYFNPLLYDLGQNHKTDYQSVFHQVYIGDNDTETAGDSPYYAAYGWNPVTGWGTPDFQQLFNYLTTLPAASYPPSITANPTALPSGYPNNSLITITGTNTHFDGSTRVSLLYNNQEMTGNLQVQGPTSLTFDLAAGLPVGEGNIAVYDPTDGTMTASFNIGAETASISPNYLKANYTATPITIMGDYCHYDNSYGGVTVQAVYATTQEPAIYLNGSNPEMQATLTGSGPPYTTADFTLPAGLQPGQYDVVVNDNYTGVSMSVPLAVVMATASPASAGPTVGTDDAITLTVLNSAGATDTTLTTPHDVTVSGYTAAPNGSYGSFNGTPLTASSTTVSVNFSNGTAAVPLDLDNAAAQAIGFSIVGVTPPATNAVTITPVPASAAAMTLTQDITAPASNGSLFARQPKVALKDQFGNICTNDNLTPVTASRNDSGPWTLTGTATETVSAGVAAWTDLGATNAAAVSGARLAFNAAGLSQITSSAVNLPAPQSSGGGGGALPSAAPVVTTISPASGPEAGGTTVTVTGTRFTGATAVKFGGVAATGFNVASNTSLTATSPAGTGTVDITVTGPGGTSTASAQDQFTYTPGVPVGPQGRTAVSPDNSAVLQVPAGAFPSTTTVTIAKTPSSSPPPPAGLTSLGVWSIDTGGVEPAPGKHVTLTLKFDTGGLKGLDPSRAGIYLYDPSGGTWTWLGGTVDLTDGTITVQLSHLSTYAAFINTGKFPDLDQVPWARPAVDTLLGADVIQGMAPEVFAPAGGLTRAQLATLLVKAAGLTPVATGSTPFTDVAPTAWYAPYVAAAYDAQLVNGTGAATFGPNAPVTRQEAAVITTRAMAVMHLAGLVGTLPAQPPTFADQSSAAPWAQGAISLAAEYLLMQGYPGGNFEPLHTLTRAEGAVVLAKFLRFVQISRTGVWPQ